MREQGVDESLCLSLYGPLRVSVSGTLVIDERFARRKAKALLALLYLERGRYLPKEELLERLWPNVKEVPGQSGRLKQTALVLRRALEAGHSRRTGWTSIVERDGSYFFNSRVPHGSDVENFGRELNLAYAAMRKRTRDVALDHFDRAFSLRRGDLLPEFRREQWAEGHIGADRERYLQALEDAAQLFGARGENSRAVELLRRAVREDPLRESSAFQLMARIRHQDPAEALRVYQRLRHALATRLQVEPEPTTTVLFRAIRRQQPPDRRAAS